MRCCECGKKIEVGDKVYAGNFSVWHTTCSEGACYAIMGGDGNLRWAGGNCSKGSIGREVVNQDKYE